MIASSVFVFGALLPSILGVEVRSGLHASTSHLMFNHGVQNTDIRTHHCVLLDLGDAKNVINMTLRCRLMYRDFPLFHQANAEVPQPITFSRPSIKFYSIPIIVKGLIIRHLVYGPRTFPNITFRPFLSCVATWGLFYKVQTASYLISII
jgi:hypothetical protein